MPANLNALIRYKTINSCLYGGKRKWSIRELMEACSEALGESRGRYNLISERTVRDDLRVMKSDILGFNAPIEQEKGLYFYSDPQFSILTLKITDVKLADRIYTFLINLRTEIQHPELESILELLCKLTNKTYEKPVLKVVLKPEERPESRQGRSTRRIFPIKTLFSMDVEEPLSESLIVAENTPSHGFPDIPLKEKVELSWGDVFVKIVE
jgi:hypothetical protein